MLSASDNDDHVMDEDAWELVHKTDKAILIRLEDGEEHWLPKSQIEFDEEERQLTLPMWLARKIGAVDD